MKMFSFDAEHVEHAEFDDQEDGNLGAERERQSQVEILEFGDKNWDRKSLEGSISKVVNDYLPKRELARRKLASASAAQLKYRKAVLEAAAEISHEFSEHYWKNILQKGQHIEQTSSNPSSNEAIKKGFLFYLNASGRYLVLREHLRTAICNMVQQKCLNLRPHGFHNHRDFQSFLHDMHVFLVDEMNEIMSSTTLQETDPLKNNLDRLLQQRNCDMDELSKATLHSREMTELGIFAEEALAQGDFETCHKLHLQRICRDRESPSRWTEFAIMWLSRGNDRMAEISVREALRKDPLHLYALLLAGIISVRHGEAHGLQCLRAALALRPMSPELLVICGIAHSLMGNDSGGDYFFQKAAYVHRTITGSNINDLEKLFTKNNARRPFNVKQFVIDMDAGVPPVVEATVDEAVDRTGSRPGLKKTKSLYKSNSKMRYSNDGGLVKTKSFGKRQELVNQQGQQDKRASLGEQEVKANKSSERKQSVSSSQKKKSISNEGGESVKGGGAESVLEKTEDPPPPPPPQPSENKPKLPFADDLNDIQLEEVDLPPLYSSLLSPWNVTEFTPKLEHHLLTVDYLKATSTDTDAMHTSGSGDLLGEKVPSGHAGGMPLSHYHNRTKSGGMFNVYIPKDDDLAPDEELREAYDKIISAEARGEFSSSGTASIETLNMITKENVGNDPGQGKRLSGGAGQGETQRQRKSSTNKRLSGVPAIPAKAKTSAGVVHQADTFASAQDDSGATSKLTNRLGSELIWAANLLLNLRVFDFADGVLAKQLYFYGKRTVQFIYLRALSLYLRQREDEALPLIKEAIEMDNASAIYWTLAGHCYYAIGNNAEAIRSYEEALKLPYTKENRHLLYLRYGSLILDNGKSKLAKRVFLHGVSKYPTPYMWLALGNVCLHRQEFDEAESAFSEANRLNSTNPIAWGHLALSSLLQNKQPLAEQAYKWAVRFGLKKGILLDVIQKVQKEKGYGDPSFPRVPNCVPHDYYLRRMGRKKPLNMYKEALNQEPPRMRLERYGDTENEMLLKRKLELLVNVPVPSNVNNMEWGGEDYFAGQNDDMEVTEFEGDDEYSSNDDLLLAQANFEKGVRSGVVTSTSRDQSGLTGDNVKVLKTPAITNLAPNT